GDDMRWTGTAASKRSATIIVAMTLLSGETFAQSSGNGVSNFLGNIFSSQKSATSPQAQAAPSQEGAPAPPSAPLPWTGEDGASGHPLMTAAAIRQAAANFPN